MGLGIWVADVDVLVLVTAGSSWFRAPQPASRAGQRSAPRTGGRPFLGEVLAAGPSTDMLCHRHGERLEAWASQAEASPVSELRGFAKGLRKYWAAVTAGLTVSYSSGAVEGHVKPQR
jgi:hypothetical protein